MKGLRFERIADGRHYNVVFHIGSTYVPVSDDTVEELKDQSLLSAERFLDLLIDRVGYSSYLKDQIRNELKATGDPTTQITVLQGAHSRAVNCILLFVNVPIYDFSLLFVFWFGLSVGIPFDIP